MKKPVKIILIVLCVVFIGVFGFSAYKIVSTINGYKQDCPGVQTFLDLAA